MLEAVRLFERGDASAEDIDTAMKLGAGMLMVAGCLLAKPVLTILKRPTYSSLELRLCP